MRTGVLSGVIAMFVAWAGLSEAQTSVPRAVEIWLNGRDQPSLAMLAGLARGGNTDARLLLSRIETMDLGPSPFRMSLSSQDSRALFRDVSGRSLLGRSWMMVEAADGNEFAQIFLRSVQPKPQLRLIERLNELGEHQATDYPTRVVALYGRPRVQMRLRSADFLMEDLRPFMDYLIGPPEPRGDGLAALRHITRTDAPEISASDPETLGMAGLLSLGYGFGDHGADNRWRPAVEDWLMSANSTLPMAMLCNAECGAAEAGPCAFALMALNGGYFESIRIDSPFERLIPQSDFLKSPRARLMVLRRAALARAETNLGWLAEREEIAEMSSCAADLIVAERAKYQKKKPAKKTE